MRKLLNKIKLNYDLKLFQDYVSNSKFDEAYKLIEDTKKKDDTDLLLLLKNSQKLLSKLPPEFYKKKIIWTISYDTSDLSYINQFLDFYLPKNLNLSFQTENFVSSLNQFFTEIDLESQIKDIEFSDFLSQSNLYQNLLLFKFDKDYLFLNSCAAFFETTNSFFIYPNITFCYFYVIKTPEKLLLRYKSSDQKNMKFKVYENRKNYNVNVKSWTDENVVNTFKGKIIYFQRLLEDTKDVLVDIVYHLKQHGMNVNINMSDIQKFVSNNKLENEIEEELSNNDKKFLSKNIDETIS